MIYPVVFIDAIHYSVRDNNVIRKLAAYVILGINCEGRKEVLSIQVGENESAKYWLSVLNELRNRGVKDILILCADGLTGIKDAIAAAYPQTEYQRCIVHQVRNTLKYVSDKDRKAFANDLKTIYNAPSEQEGREALDEVTEKWQEKYSRAMKRWYDNWDAVSPIFKFSKDVRTVIYTTNAIESLNSTYANAKQRTIATARYFSAGLLPVAAMPIETHVTYYTMDPVFEPSLNFVTEEYIQDAIAQIAERGGEAGLDGILSSLNDAISAYDALVEQYAAEEPMDDAA